ncbi:MAG: NAD(P)/FAD-dependent oxidoreductase [Parvibaculum sp.]|nr:NAD(P)/FAD-dependent oxidoreductase [Parvibaculum sp.]
MSLSDRHFDAIVIGAGHNGLIAASYLAKAGRRVLLLEASTRLGGALTTAEVSPDYRVSTAAHLLDALPRRIEKDLKLARHGLRYAKRTVQTIALDHDLNHITLSSKRSDLDILRRHSPADAAAYPRFAARMKSYAGVLGPLLQDMLPAGAPEPLSRRLRRLIWRAERLGSETLEDLMRQLPGSIGDMLDDAFETPLLKGALALDAVIGTGEGPYSAGTALNAITRKGLRSISNGPHIVEGGLGGFTDALSAAAASFGVIIRAATDVKRILIVDGMVRGVETQSGDVYEAPLVLSSAHPRETMLGMVGAKYLDAGLVKQLTEIVDTGATAKLNLSLDGLPTIQGLSPQEYGARFLITPSLASLDGAYAAFKHGGFATDLPLEMTIPSVTDAPLAPPGQHVMSIVIQYVPYQATGGWEGSRDRLVDHVIETLSEFAPDLRDRIVAGELMLPQDFERKFGLVNGGWYHGDMRLDQLLTSRPAPGLARFSTPLRGLYLCGAGSHPGGGICGLPGEYAARLALSEGVRA